MDTRTGKIVDKDVIDALSDTECENFIRVDEEDLTEEQIETRQVGRNDQCPCGSGKKFKHCHWQGRHPTRRKEPLTKSATHG